MVGVDVEVVTALIGAASAVIVASIGILGVIVTRKLDHNAEKLDTGNGHTVGQAVARLEEMGWRHENRIDKMDAKFSELLARFDEHLDEVRVLREQYEADRG